MDVIETIEEDYKVQPVRNKYYVQKWDKAEFKWVDMKEHKYGCRIEAEEVKRFLIASKKSNKESSE